LIFCDSLTVDDLQSAVTCLGIQLLDVLSLYRNEQQL